MTDWQMRANDAERRVKEALDYLRHPGLSAATSIAHAEYSLRTPDHELTLRRLRHGADFTLDKES